MLSGVGWGEVSTMWLYATCIVFETAVEPVLLQLFAIRSLPGTGCSDVQFLSTLLLPAAVEELKAGASARSAESS